MSNAFKITVTSILFVPVALLGAAGLVAGNPSAKMTFAWMLLIGVVPPALAILWVSRKRRVVGENVPGNNAPASAAQPGAQLKGPQLVGAVVGCVIFGIFLLVKLNSVDSAGSSTIANNLKSNMISAASSESALHEKLQTQAIQMMHDGQVGVSGLCDKMYDDKIDSVTYGTIAAGVDRLPAMKAHYTFMCVNPVNGAREKNSDFWITLALDDFSDKVRCLKTANKEIVDQIASECGFRAEGP